MNSDNSTKGGKVSGWSCLNIIRSLLVVLAANTAVALFFAIILQKSLLNALVYSHSIGLSILGIRWLLHGRRHGGRQPHVKAWRGSVVAIALGGAFGVTVARIWECRTFGLSFFDNPYSLVAPMAGVVVFGGVIAQYFHARAAVAEGRVRLQEEMLRGLESEQKLTEAELKLLQAQIEPHFLFNTLSNILQLIDADPKGAKQMLFNLTSYLRASLQRTRAGATTLGEELDLVRAYLDIQKVRMGARLAYRIDCVEGLREQPLPPLLLQPLVENSVHHGLGPQPQGGEVAIEVNRNDDTLTLVVTDTGLGMSAHSAVGVGLTNVRDRVRAISHGRGEVTIHANTPRGLRVCIELPLAVGPVGASKT